MPGTDDKKTSGGGAPSTPSYRSTALTGVPRPTLLGQISIARMIRVARKKWVTIAAVFGFFVVTGLFYLVMAKRVYRAATLVELSLRRPRIAGQRDAVIDDNYSFVQSEEVFNTQLEKFKGKTIEDLAFARIRAQAPDMNLSDQRLQRRMRDGVSMTLLRRSRLVRITFDHSDPAFAATAANAYAGAAEAMAAAENKTASDNAVSWLEAQAAPQRKALETGDRALVDFTALNRIDALERQKKTVEQSLSDFNLTLTQIASQEYLAEELRNRVAALELSPENAGRLPDSIPRSKEIQTMLEQWIAAVSERDALLTKYTAKHPEVVAKEKVITVLREQVTSAIRRGKETAESNLSLLRQQAASLRQKIEEHSKLASDLELQIVDRMAKRAALERERDAADISYKGILNRIEEARLSADENTATVKIVEPARKPENPVWPSASRVLLLAMFLGCVGGLGLALLTDSLEDYVTSADDLEADIGLKVLGFVPHAVQTGSEELALASLGEQYALVSETFAGIRALLDSPQYKSMTRSVVVASTAPGDGKTFVSCNLAIMSARSGLRTLLVDFDMRRPKIAKIFKVPPRGEDLMRALKSSAAPAFTQLPFATSCPGLDVIATQEGARSPVDVIGGRSVREFLKWAERQYDRVIVDSPPFGIISDSAVLASHVGCVVLVCRFHKSRKWAIGYALRQFIDIGAKVIGVVVNDVDVEKDAAFGGYDYYEHYKTYARSAGPDSSQ